MISLSNVSFSVTTHDEADYSIKHTLTNLLRSQKTKMNSETQVPIFESLNLEVRAGESLGLLGQNGVGKTTLLRLISGILTPSSGNITIGGRVRCLIQPLSGIIEQATGEENIILKGLEFRLSHSEINKHIDEVKKFVDLGKYINRPVYTYSTGMKTRLAVGIQILGDFDILVIDEGIGTTDEYFRPKITDLLNRLRSNSKCLVMASHDKELLMSNTSRIVKIQNGAIVEH